MNIIIWSPEYTDSYGGVITLHKLAKILANDHNVFITSRKTLTGSNVQCIDEKTAKRLVSIDSLLEKKEYIAIYPEIVFGNPLGCEKVIRWVLYYPGVNGGPVEYNEDELVFTYNKLFVKGTKYQDVPVLFTLDAKLDKFINNGSERDTNSYLVKKGKNKFPKINMFFNHIHNGILIDNYIGNNNIDNELVNIFNKSEYFLSYDSASYHSLQAALCGATSIIVPDDNITKEEFMEMQPIMKYGVAWGMEDIEWAESTKHLVRDHLIDMELQSMKSVQNMIKQVLSEIHPE